MVATKAALLAAFLLGFQNGDCNARCVNDGEDTGRWSVKEKACICSHKRTPDEEPLPISLKWNSDHKPYTAYDDRPYNNYRYDID